MVKGQNEMLQSPGLVFRDQLQRRSNADPTPAKNKALLCPDNRRPSPITTGRAGREVALGSPRLCQLGHHLTRAIGVGFQLQGN